MYIDRLVGQLTQYLKRHGYVAALLLTAPVLAVAAVPNTFVNGQSADADQVNENFANLDNRLAALEGSLPGVAVDCDLDADALQDAIDAAPPGGQEITVSGTCNSISIFGKLNLVVDGQGITTILANSDEDALSIGVSPLVMISGVAVDANNLGVSAVRVGASTVIFTDLTARNAPNEPDIGINTNGVAIFTGNTEIGVNDPNDPGAGVALEMDERASMLAEGILTINGKVDMADFSFFDQDSEGESGNTLTINGDMDIGPASRMEVENGTLNGVMSVGGGSFLARPGGVQTVSINGDVRLFRSSLFLDGLSGGTINLNSASLHSQQTSLVTGSGAGVTFGNNAIRSDASSQILVTQNAVVDPGTTFFLTTFTSMYSTSFIDAASVTCFDSTKVSAIRQSPEYVDLCVSPDPNAP